MSDSPNPLETRSLPGALWESVPKSVSFADESLRNWFASHVNGSLSPWREIRWLTESDLGVGLLCSIFVAVYLFLVWKKKSSGENAILFFRRQSQRILLILLSLSFANLVSVALKRIIGRLKPHVNWWDKAAALPALSCPSSHAFNTAFFLALLFLFLDSHQRREWKWYLLSLFFLTFVIGLSRIIFTQHYPIDVLLGWLLGAGLAFLMTPFIKCLLKNKLS